MTTYARASVEELTGTAIDLEATTEEEELRVTAIDSDTTSVEELRATEELMVTLVDSEAPLMRS